MKNPRVLKTPACRVGEGQRCGPPTSVIKTAGSASEGRRTSPLPALKVMLAWVSYFLNFYCLKGKNCWLTLFLHGKFLFKTLLMGGVGWVGIADATVEETVLLEFVLHKHVFLCVSCFLMLPPASPGPTHSMI